MSGGFHVRGIEATGYVGDGSRALHDNGHWLPLPVAGGGAGCDAAVVDYTAGATQVIVDDSTAAHIAFPSVVTLRNGRHFVGYRTSAVHGWSSSGAARCKVSTDDAATWSTARTILDTTGDDNIGGVTQLHDDRVLALVIDRPTSTESSWSTRSLRSSDEGVTWDIPVSIDAGFTGFEYGSDAITLPSGDVLAAVYGTDATDHYAVAVASTDDGDTWMRRSIIAQGAGQHWQEPRFVLTPWGELLAFLRYESGGVYRIYLARSLDEGRTWSTPVMILADAGGMPAAHVTRNGVLVMAYRNKASGMGDRSAWAVSFDRGNTWQTRGNYEPSNLGYVYADWCDLADGDVALVYGLENYPTQTSADIYARRFPRALAEKLPLAYLDTTGASEGDTVKLVSGAPAWAAPASPGGGTTTRRWEVVMTPGASSPPVPVETPDGTDWIYVEVSN